MNIRKHEYLIICGSILTIAGFVGVIATFLHKEFYNADRPIHLPPTMYQKIVDFITPRLYGEFLFCLGIGIGLAIAFFFIKYITKLAQRSK